MKKERSKNRGSAIIPYHHGIILIQRRKGDKDHKEEYYTIPGGGQEEGETIQEATIREVREELGIEIILTDTCYKIVSQGRKQYFFVAKYKSGKIGTGIGKEMTNTDYEKYGAYLPRIVPKEKLKDIRLLPTEIKDIIVTNINKIVGEK